MGEVGWVSSLGGCSNPSWWAASACRGRQSCWSATQLSPACWEAEAPGSAANPGMLQSVPAEAQPVLLLLLLSHPVLPRKTVPSGFIFM